MPTIPMSIPPAPYQLYWVLGSLALICRRGMMKPKPPTSLSRTHRKMQRETTGKIIHTT